MSTLQRVVASIIHGILSDLQLIQSNPVSIFTSPDSFVLPFTGALDTIYNVTNGVPHHHNDSWGFLGLAILFAGLDLAYSILRLFAAGIFVGFIICVTIYAFVLVLVRVRYRWLILESLTNELEWKGVF